MISAITEWLGVATSPTLEVGLTLILTLTVGLTFILLMSVLFSSLVNIFKIGK